VSPGFRLLTDVACIYILLNITRHPWPVVVGADSVISFEVPSVGFLGNSVVNFFHELGSKAPSTQSLEFPWLSLK
jgi:hypothetical protein